MIRIALDADPQEVFFNVVAAARSELDVVNMGTGSKFTDLARLPEHPKAKPSERIRIRDALRGPRVSAHSAAESDAGRSVGQNTQEDAQQEHAAIPHV